MFGPLPFWHPMTVQRKQLFGRAPSDGARDACAGISAPTSNAKRSARAYMRCIEAMPAFVRTIVLVLLVLQMTKVGAEELLKYSELGTCLPDEYYNVNSLLCVKCSALANLVPTGDGNFLLLATRTKNKSAKRKN
jgi:hypothetical protein